MKVERERERERERENQTGCIKVCVRSKRCLCEMSVTDRGVSVVGRRVRVCVLLIKLCVCKKNVKRWSRIS